MRQTLAKVLRSTVRRAGTYATLLALGFLGSGCKSAAPDFEPIIQAEDTRRVDAPALAEAVAASDARLRARAALAYGRIAEVPGIAPLLGLLGDADATVKGAAAFSVGQLGWFESRKGHEAALIAGLTPLLTDSDGGVRSRAISALGKLATPDALAPLATPLLHDADAQVRAEAATALHRCRQLARARDAMAMLPPLSEDTVAALRTLGGDGEVVARRAAIYYFARNQEPRGLALAQKLVQDPDVWVRLYAVLALKRIADASATPTLVAATADPEYTVRVAAVQALAALNQAAMLPLPLLSDPTFHVRAAVCAAYGDSTDVDEQRLVAPWTTDASVTVRASALAALAKRRKAAAAPLLTMALGDASPEIRATAVSSVSALGLTTAAAATLLQRGLTDPTERVRVAVQELLGDIPEAWAYSAIQAALLAPAMAERATAAAALAGRTESDRFTVAWQGYLTANGRQWRDTRQALLDVVAKDPGAVSTEHLLTAARDPEVNVSQHARELLMARGVTDLPAAATVFTYSPFRDLRFAANPVVALATTRGTFEVECFAADAPIHVASFIGLTRKGTYNGLPWHRVVSDFVVQGGDPEGSGWGDAGFSLRAEINQQRFDRGTLGMPRSDDFDSGGSQLFFNHIPTPHLDGQYTVFGQIRSGVEVVDQLEQGDLIQSAKVVE